MIEERERVDEHQPSPFPKILLAEKHCMHNVHPWRWTQEASLWGPDRSRGFPPPQKIWCCGDLEAILWDSVYGRAYLPLLTAITCLREGTIMVALLENKKIRQSCCDHLG